MKRTSSGTEPAKKQRNDALVLKKLWPHQRSAIKWMAQREFPSDRGYPSGGLLADFPGLGKTASILGLVFWEHLKNPQLHTLIIVPASLLLKWRNEWFKHFAAAEDSVVLYHGEKRKDCVELNQNNQWVIKPNASIVITTCGTVLSDYKSYLAAYENEDSTTNEAAAGILFRVQWQRIVIDESHLSVQNEKAKKFAALSALQSLRRWAVSGTVVTNSWKDVAFTCQWLNIPPYNNPNWWKENWTSKGPIRLWRFGHKQQLCQEARLQGFVASDFESPQTLACILIREKSLIKGLPGLEIKNVALDLSKGELATYDIYAREFKAAVARYFAAKQKRSSGEQATEQQQPIVRENLINLFNVIARHLTRLRQLCNHSRLAHGAALTLGYRADILNCVECSSEEGRLINASCGHLLCDDCKDLLAAQCSACSLSPLLNEAEAQCKQCYSTSHADWRSIECPLYKPNTDLHQYGRIGHSNKFEAILACLDAWSAQDQEQGVQVPFKVVIFSQWVSSFNLLEPVLRANGYGSLQFTGEIKSLEERERVLSRFTRDSSIQVLLCGLKVSSVGLDLVMANRCILLEPWWNLPTEEQAGDRLHRMGQTRNVTVVKLTMRWSIEDWIVELQRKKASESDWLSGKWNGSNSISPAHFTAKELAGLNLYLCRSYYFDHRKLK